MELAIDLNTMDASQLARLYILLKETRQGFTAALVRDYGISNCGTQAWQLEVIYQQQQQDHLKATYR